MTLRMEGYELLESWRSFATPLTPEEVPADIEGDGVYDTGVPIEGLGIMIIIENGEAYELCEQGLLEAIRKEKEPALT